MPNVELFVTPGYGEAMVKRLRYSQALRIGDRVETSGQGGWDDEFNIPEALDAEIRLAFDNLTRTLALAGAKWSDVVHINSYHVIDDERGASWEDHNAVMTPQFAEHLGDVAPIWTQSGVTSLGLPAMRVEIRVTAILNQT
ncbi:hypothetical protein FK535_24755 [Mycolicibacterium sp. 018/SC-01/001]|uniref:Rid family hydrolase n=1 Tax=Mycolicibacterium sp. 018/SC-01/001 TaxID=2592069 RepID=UPI0011804979|nr:Rid family hydrolase [Mycolicibacterium sp. 018/SC-01/001]TRW78573.1 hypothetical protein FK535_24755 [Mycolicibacterium sp. 018/SC-01/001]